MHHTSVRGVIAVGLIISALVAIVTTAALGSEPGPVRPETSVTIGEGRVDATPVIVGDSDACPFHS